MIRAVAQLVFRATQGALAQRALKAILALEILVWLEQQVQMAQLVFRATQVLLVIRVLVIQVLLGRRVQTERPGRKVTLEPGLRVLLALLVQTGIQVFKAILGPEQQETLAWLAHKGILEQRALTVTQALREIPGLERLEIRV